MVTGTINIKINAQSSDNAKKIGSILQNISDTVNENDLLKIYDIIQKKPDFFKNVISKMNNPLVAKALGI
jgi:uncharacterized protein YfkK (UPF0435 family)